ncbi:MAG TPA: hypothetical protein VF207_04035 [Chthoniobacterales bacterium]
MNKLVMILKRSASKSIFLAGLFGLAFVTSGFAAATADSCATNSANRQLDYWLGNWKIGAEGSSGNAHSTVTLSLDKCLVVENWDGGRGHYGQNVFGYSADDKSWYGMFADNEGRVHIFTSGSVTPGSAEFEGTSRGPKGESVLNRVKIIRLNPNKVEQTWEKSNDNGSTWNVVFRGEYSRANP